jgi:hypothetical protein
MNDHLKVLSVILIGLLFAGCSSPARMTREPLDQRLDKDTVYRVDDQPGGFTVNVEVSRYQFVSELAAVIDTAKGAVVAVAKEHAAGRAIIVPADSEIRVSTGRNGVIGISTVRAQADIRFKD